MTQSAPVSTLHSAILLLQHLANLAQRHGDPAAHSILQAADFLQDTLDTSEDLDDPASLNALLAQLAPLAHHTTPRPA